LAPSPTSPPTSLPLVRVDTTTTPHSNANAAAGESSASADLCIVAPDAQMSSTNFTSRPVTSPPTDDVPRIRAQWLAFANESNHFAEDDALAPTLRASNSSEIVPLGDTETTRQLRVARHRRTY
jgi:hypothetical protein